MAIAFVRQATGTTTITITAASDGNTLVLCAVSFRSPAARTISSIATTNVTWVKLGNVTSGTTDAEIWYGTVAGGSSGTTVTLTMSGSGATVASNVSEFSGLMVAGTIEDGTETTNSGSSSSPSTGNYTPTFNGDLLITCEGHADGTVPSVQPGGIWTDLTFANNSTVCGVQGNYALNQATSVASASWTINNVAWRTVIGGLKAKDQPRSVFSAISATDSAFRTFELQRSVSESISAADAKPQTGKGLSFSSAISASDTATKAVSTVRVHPATRTESIPTWDSVRDVVTIWSQTFAAGESLPHGLVFAGGYIFACLRTSPGKLLRIDPANPSAYDVVTFDSDGVHNTAIDLVYIAAKGKLYVLFLQNRVVVSEVDPSTLAVSNVINDTTSPSAVNLGSFAYDATYLYVLCYLNTPSVVIRYALSDFSRVSSVNVDANTKYTFGHALRYDGTNLYATGQTNEAPFNTAWIAKIDPSTFTVSGFGVLTIAVGAAPTDDFCFTTNDVWLGTEGVGYVVKVSKADVTSYTNVVLPASCFGVFTDGTSILALLDTRPGLLVQIDPTSLALQTAWFPSGFNSPNEFVSNTDEAYFTFYMDPGKLAATNFPITFQNFVQLLTTGPLIVNVSDSISVTENRTASIPTVHVHASVFESIRATETDIGRRALGTGAIKTSGTSWTPLTNVTVTNQETLWLIVWPLTDVTGITWAGHPVVNYGAVWYYVPLTTETGDIVASFTAGTGPFVLTASAYLTQNVGDGSQQAGTGDPGSGIIPAEHAGRSEIIGFITKGPPTDTPPTSITGGFVAGQRAGTTGGADDSNYTILESYRSAPRHPVTQIVYSGFTPRDWYADSVSNPADIPWKAVLSPVSSHPTEAISVAESATANLPAGQLARSIFESISVVGQIQTFTIEDRTITVLDAVTAQLLASTGLSRSVSDSVTVSDVVKSALQLGSRPFEQIGIVENRKAVVSPLASHPAESISVLDTKQTILGLGNRPTESITVTDFFGKGLVNPLAVHASDSISVADVGTAAIQLGLRPFESISATDALTKSVVTPLAVHPAEAINVSEFVNTAVAGAGALVRSVVEDISVSDSVHPAIPAILAQPLESIAVSDVLLRILGQLGAVYESINVSEFVKPLIPALSVRPAESISSTDSIQAAITGAGALAQSVSDDISISDVIHPAIPLLSIRPAETISASDTASILLGLGSRPIENISVSTSTLAAVPLALGISESTTVTDSIQVVLSSGIPPPPPFGTNSSALGTFRLGSMNLGHQVPSVVGDLTRSIAQTISISDTIQAALFPPPPLVQSVSETVSVLDIVTAQLALNPFTERHPFETIAVFDEALADLNFTIGRGDCGPVRRQPKIPGLLIDRERNERKGT